jgi:uncharacterized protein (UPF0261 family)
VEAKMVLGGVTAEAKGTQLPYVGDNERTTTVNVKSIQVMTPQQQQDFQARAENVASLTQQQQAAFAKAATARQEAEAAGKRA